jgi:hypothetical protein
MSLAISVSFSPMSAVRASAARSLKARSAETCASKSVVICRESMTTSVFVMRSVKEILVSSTALDAAGTTEETMSPRLCSAVIATS